ncbi:MAG: hypothetical protein LBG48_04540 [Rickettsiales bacterium]|jgi:type IV secretory pathway VirB4 component|nr:hypothetical protein [Rickettsiales bacterium]MDR2830893.1 hypothetical protein [Candidatus Methanovirga basalitermitum]
MFKNKKIKQAKTLTDIIDENKTTAIVKDFLTNISPSIIKFEKDYYIVGNTFRRVVAIRSYPFSTTEQALLSFFSEKENVNLKIYTYRLNGMESEQKLESASRVMNANYFMTERAYEQITTQSDIAGLNKVMDKLHKEREDLISCAVYIELIGKDIEHLHELENTTFTFLKRSKINYDSLIAQQREGFLTVSPFGSNQFKNQFHRPMPQSSAANLFPFSYSGKTERGGFFIGKDLHGTSVIPDFNIRTNDKKNSNIVIMGNSGEGKSYLLKLILINIFMSGKNITGLDPDGELEELTKNLGGSYLDLMDGHNKINVLEPKLFDDGEGIQDIEIDKKMRLMFDDSGHIKPKLSQHISFLRAFFKTYKPEFSDEEIDTLAILLEWLYAEFRITNDTNFLEFTAKDYPIMSDLYNFIDNKKNNFKNEKKLQSIIKEEILRKILLGIHAMSMGDQQHYFNGYTNIKSDKFVIFGVKDILNADINLKNAMLFNALTYMGDMLLTRGNTMMVADEFHVFLSNLVAVTYITNYVKRVRKKDSMVLLATQNIEDFMHPNVSHLTSVLVSIPTHQFFFYPGSISHDKVAKFLQLEQSEIQLINKPAEGHCLFKTGNERFHLHVIAPDYKARLFGSGGGRGAI